MRKLQFAAIAIGVVIGATALAPIAQGAKHTPADQAKIGVDAISDNEAGSNKSLTSFIRPTVNVLLFVLGALAVLMIVFGGFKYVVSRGDPAEVTSAKNTILYAIVGVVVALLAYAIVQFVAGRFSATSTTDPCSDPANSPPPGMSGPTPAC